jgi:hypothetical protein
MAVRIEWCLAGGGVGLALVQTVRLWWSRAAVTWRLGRQQRRAADGERRAEPLLERRGYVIEARQQVGSWRLGVAREELAVEVRADFIVRRGRRRLVAEVKTGRHAPLLESAATRRQLLEYRFAFAVDGVLLVDVEAGRVEEVRFPLPAAPRPAPLAVWMALAFVLGGVVGIAHERGELRRFMSELHR